MTRWAALSLLLASCAGSAANPAGTTHVTGAACGGPFEFHDGKERGAVTLTVACSDGTTIEFTSGESTAFEGQAAAAQANAATADALRTLAEKIPLR